MMKISKDDLTMKLFEWGDDLPFKIDEDVIVVDDMNQFTSALDAQFADWDDKELSKEGKV